MSAAGRPKVVLLGMMTRKPWAGVVWQTLHYLEGFRRLGCDVWYVEAHAKTPYMLMRSKDDDSTARAVEFLDALMRRFDLGDRWAFHALHDDGRCRGLDDARLKRLYRDAALIVNLHGGTSPLPEHHATGRLVYLETDPVEIQAGFVLNPQVTADYLAPHAAFFTYAEGYGRPGCPLPVSERFPFKPTRQPVVLDFWREEGSPGGAFTTIGNWRQAGREVVLDGEVYHWSKHLEFLKFLDLPRRTGQDFELALSGIDDADRRVLEGHGWRVRDALAFTLELDPYRDYIVGSRAEFTVAKDQNVRLRTGWFSDRGATYLAAGRPVVTQDTGFGAVLPTGRGLFAFRTTDEAAAAVEAVNADYEKHRRAALGLAREFFSHEVVLGRLLADVGL